MYSYMFLFAINISIKTCLERCPDYLKPSLHDFTTIKSEITMYGLYLTSYAPANKSSTTSEEVWRLFTDSQNLDNKLFYTENAIVLIFSSTTRPSS